MNLKHLPNIITACRLVLLIPFLYTLFVGNYVVTFFIFIAAGLSDGLDGWLARRYHWQSQLGGFLDPLSDKLFLSSSYISLAYLNQIPWWLVVIVLTRDVIIVSSVAIWGFIMGYVDFNPSFLSKTNTVLQGLVVFVALFQMAYISVPSWFFNSLLFVIAVTTCLSFVNYAWVWGKMAINKLQARRR